MHTSICEFVSSSFNSITAGVILMKFGNVLILLNGLQYQVSNQSVYFKWAIRKGK